MQAKTVKKKIKPNKQANKTKQLLLKSLHIIFPFARRGYAPDLSHSLSAEPYLPKQVATLCEAAGRNKALLAL